MTMPVIAQTLLVFLADYYEKLRGNMQLIDTCRAEVEARSRELRLIKGK